MNKTNGISFLIKLISTILAAWIAFDIFGNTTFGWIFIIGILGSILNLVIGDFMILPKYGNMTAVICDILLAAFLVLMIDWMSDNFDTTFTSIFIFAIIILLFEYFFHNYLRQDK